MDSNDDKQADLSQAKTKAEEDIFAAMGAADIPDEEKGALLARMLDLVQSRSLLKIVDKLSDEKKDELEKLSEQEDATELESFLIKSVPEYEQIFIDEAKRLRQELTIEFAE